MNNLKKAHRYFRHILGFSILAFFVASFFIGVKVDPNFIDIARSPYGLFTYFIIASLTVFIPSMVTIPIVTTATIIWGPWLAGGVAIVGWTIGGVFEYYAAYFAMGSVNRFFNIAEFEKKIARVRRSINFWQLAIARTFVPAFVFGMARTPIVAYIGASIIAYVPLAIIGAGSGELLRAYLDQIQPLLVGAALIVLIFTLDYFSARKESHAEIT